MVNAKITIWCPRMAVTRTSPIIEDKAYLRVESGSNERMYLVKSQRGFPAEKPKASQRHFWME
ncbi:unnamed protein product [Cylicocyclus nassatus]|uniref:Uncharacterized protein n=1 Tax=Cylicocyclus nassatus TaxID=53992 RepID=A0AA36DSR7_CYLNA|nr:unnamed protein product [Cylicocyclus nassatus]